MLSLRFFQGDVRDWVIRTFGFELYQDKRERAERVAEEAVEVVQAAGLSRERMHQIVDWVYNKPPGDLQREIGGMLLPLSALASAHKIELEQAVSSEFAFASTNSLRIARKNRIKKEELDNLFPPNNAAGQ